MSVQLDWQQDLEDEGWPRRHDYGPPGKGSRFGRYILIAVFVLLAAGAAALWTMNQSGLRAVKADIQEAVTYIHWAAQQGDPELYINTLDSTSPRWIELARAEWQRVSTSALDMPDPTVETVSMNGNIAEAAVRWTDATTGRSYLARRWFRLDGRQWLWTQPRSQGQEDLQTEQLAHITLSFHGDDGEVAPAVLPQLDDLIAARCQEFAVSEQSCHFYIQWDVTDASGQPLLWRDMPLPPLASTTGDDMDAPIYLVNGREADWRSAELRRRLQQFYPGRIFVAQSTVSMRRPVEALGLPDSLPGDPFNPLRLPSPTLEGIDDRNQPHPRWLAHVDRQLTDLVLRRAERYILGSADYVNAIWALHQAVLASKTGVPTTDQLAGSDQVAPASAVPVEMPDLSGLGAALQTNPDSVAVQQLAGLVRYLQDNWNAADLAGLPQFMGTAASLDLLLNEILASDIRSFTTGWREQQWGQPRSPLATLGDNLADLVRQEAFAWRDGRDAALALYSEEGRDWRLRSMESVELFGALSSNDQWQVDIDAIGAAGPAVWIDVTINDGAHSARDLRFYVKDDQGGWLRDRPVESFWGNSRSASGGLVRWSYYEIDEATVQAVMPSLESAYRRVAEDFGLPASPLSLTVEADTAVSWEPGQWSADISAPSPRSYILLDTGDDAEDALRREVTARMIVRAWQQKALELSAASGDETDRGWSVLASAVFAEFEAFEIPTEALLAENERDVARALEQGRLPEISQLLVEPLPSGGIEAQSQVLLAMYVFQRHGFRWLEGAMIDGLPVTLDLVMQERGWTLADLEADWRAYLAEREID